MTSHKVASWSELVDRQPAYALVGDVDLVVVRYGDVVSVLYGRCAYRGAFVRCTRLGLSPGPDATLTALTQQVSH